MRRNYGKQRLDHETHQEGSSSCHTNIWYSNIFNGYCSTCHKYGHHAVGCKNHENKGSIDKISSRRCTFVGHTTKLCHTIRFHQCDAFSHKYKMCRKTIIQPKHENDAAKKPRQNCKGSEMKTTPSTQMRKFKKLWRLKGGVLNPHVKTNNTCGKEILEENIQSINDDYTIDEVNPSNEEDLDMAVLLC